MKKTLSIFVSILYIWQSFADSPLTSITFYSLYKENNIIVKTKYDAILNDNSCKFLSSPSVSNGEKAALVNALGWHFEGQQNAKIYSNFLKLKYKCKKSLTLSKLSATELMCMAYLTAMDDYFHPEKALPYIEKAVAMDGKSMSIRLVHTLILAQIHSESDWCAVWKSYEAFLAMKDALLADIKPEVLTEVEEYLVLYKSSCR